MSLNNREFLIWKESRGETGVGGCLGQQAGIFKVKIGLEKLEGRDTDTER
jgi:hypothetical protein